MTHVSKEEHEKMMKDMQRDIERFKRSKKYARKYALEIGFITPTGRLSRKFYSGKGKIKP
jgi:hypothetical protein